MKKMFFVTNEEKQLCRSLFHMSQRSSYKKLERKTYSFLEPIAHHYNTNWLSCGEHPIKSLEMKWGFIKHNVSKFCGNYHGVLFWMKVVVLMTMLFKSPRIVQVQTFE